MLVVCEEPSHSLCSSGSGPLELGEWRALPCDREVGCSVLVLGVLLDLGGGLLVLFTDFVELLHVIEKLCAALESDE